MIYAGKTDKGMVRKTNQDDFAVGSLGSGVSYAVVCDGMGGANGGNVASSTAVKVISEAIINGFNASLSDEDIRALICGAILRANGEVYGMSRSDPALYGMGTTVVAALARAGRAFIAHAGDSRAYIYDAALRKLTRDHSIVQEMLENGKITQEEAVAHPQKNIITRALGVEDTLDIDFCITDFNEGSAILICTDGLTNLVADEEIHSALTAFAPQQCVEELVGTANAKGGSDNITVVVIYNANTGSEVNG